MLRIGCCRTVVTVITIRPSSLAPGWREAEELSDGGASQPAAAQRPSFLLDQPAPHSVSTHTVGVPQRELQAVRPYRARGTDGDGLSSLVPRLVHLLGDRKPFVGIDAGTGAPGLPVHPARELAVGQVARFTAPTARLRDHQHRLHLLPRCCMFPFPACVSSSSRCRRGRIPRPVSRAGLLEAGPRGRGSEGPPYRPWPHGQLAPPRRPHAWHALRDRHLRVGTVELVQVDPVQPQPGQAAVAGLPQVLRAPVGHPLPRAGPGQAARPGRWPLAEPASTDHARVRGTSLILVALTAMAVWQAAARGGGLPGTGAVPPARG